jgi:FtsP/CotA-like multicopper oxidase with cupredoxin domain
MYHAHMNDHEQIGNGMYGAFIIDERDGGTGAYAQDRIMLLSNFKGNYLINGKEFPNLADADGDGQPDEVWLVKKGDLIRVRMINISAVEFHPMHFHGHFTKEIAKDGTDISNADDARVENTVLVAPGTTVDVSVKMEAPGKGAWLFHCHIITHVMGPDGKSLNPLLANGGMVAPVIYSDSLNFQQILDSVTAAYGELPDRSGDPVGSTAPIAHELAPDHTPVAIGGAQ